MVLDAYEIMPQHSYTLEVSSPGLRRPLNRQSDYERFKGRKVKIKTTNPVDDRRVFSGTLLGMEGEMISGGSRRPFLQRAFRFRQQGELGD